jgi:hypothetical protein
MANYDTPLANTQPAAAADDGTVRPFAYAGISSTSGGVTLNRLLQQTVQEVAADANAETPVTARAAELTVKDLNDLAADFSGVRSNNPKIADLTVEDLNSLEALFYDVKMNSIKTASAVASGDAQASFLDAISCCCCTPCCCCAASEPTPFDS